MNTSTSILIITQQQARLGRFIARYKTQNEQFVGWRIWTFVGGFIGLLVALAIDNLLALIVFSAWISGFTLLIRQHRHLRDTLTRFEIAHYLRGIQLARLRLDWDQLPISTATAASDHPFATDIDIVGEYSLHRLLDTSVSRGGSDRLLRWLLRTSPPNKADIARVQHLVGALRPLTTFRHQLALEAYLIGIGRGGWRASIGRKWEGTRLSAWLAQAHPAIPAHVVMILGLNALVTAVLFILSSIYDLPPFWLASFVLYALLSIIQFRNIGNLFGEALALYAELGQLRAILNHLETFRVQDSVLRELLATFQAVDKPPSAHLHRLDMILGAASLQANPILWMLVNIIIPYDMFWGYQLGKSKGDLANQLPMWLETIYELEALGGLAEFSALHPQHPFPAIHDTAQFRGIKLGHPHIPYDVRVCNDFAFDKLGDMVIITGSNMAGKSSFLRTVGINLVLAYAGSVVCAEQLDVGMFRLFTCIRVNDSVVDGISYFYAEVKRLKALLDALQADANLPLFFLIDEIFRGTNNRERLIGSKAYIQALANGHGVGLISTHDLELVSLADEIPTIRNLHFREYIANGVMIFDYILREGPCPTTNALMIMRLAGLPISSAKID